MSLNSKDPYRVVRKHSEIGPPKYEQNLSLETSIPHLSPTQHFPQDPYNRQNDRKYIDPEKRANSYLPYSNHSRDPSRPIEPIYLDEDLSSSHSTGQYGPVGSLLQDNIAMDMTDNTHNAHQLPHKNISMSTQPLGPAKKKRWWTRLGISGRKLVFFAFSFIILVAVTWYFVWPRIPTLQYVGAYLDDNPTLTNVSMTSIWKVNFTVLNSDNWIPTNVQNFAISVIDGNTGVTFGKGNSNSLLLAPRSIDQVITIPIHINYTASSSNDPTFQDLSSSCSIVNQDLSNPLKQAFDIKFLIVYYIKGILWHTISTVSPTTTYFQCPTSTD